MSSPDPAGLHGMTITKTHVDKISTVCVAVADQDKVLAFYVDQLGFEVRADAPFGGGYRWIEVAPAGAATTIALAPPPPGAPAPGGAQTGITLETKDIDAFHRALQDAGVDVAAEVSRMDDPVPPLLWFRDPEGNVLMAVEA
jgi:catechol 2,3-dioxygenase-like lactoylglutathione lyase family enzyme